MKIEANSPEEYIEQLSDDRQQAMRQLRQTLRDNLPAGFAETMSYGMIGYVVPHTLYPAGYHVDTALPLPFINIASQKNFIALYHMGLYADEDLLDWFVQEYAKQVKTKLDMGKSCIRFKNVARIPYALIGELAGRMSVEKWIGIYSDRNNAN